MIVLITMILTPYFLIMAIVALCRRDYEKGPIFLVAAGMLFIAYNSSMNLSSFEHKAQQLEFLVSLGLYHF